MTPVIFVCMLRHTAATAVDLLRDVAGAAQRGDHVLIIDDAGQHDLRPQATQRHINRFLSQDGWPEGVSSTMIVTGTPAMGDLGVTVNLALAQLAIPGAAPDRARVLFLAGGTRLCAQSLAAARRGADAGGHDLFLLPWQRWRFDLGRVADAPEAAVWAARPGETASDRARRLFPPLQGLLVERRLLQQLRADEGRRAYGTLALVWHLLTKARSIGIGDALMGHAPDDRDLDPDLIAAAKDLLRCDPAAAPALASALARLLPQVTPGVRGALLTAAMTDPRPLPVLPDAAGDQYPLRLLTSKDRSRLAQALPRPGADMRAAPALLGRAKIKLSLAGRHARLMPFSWEALRPLWQDRAETVAAGEATDLVLWAHPQDPNQDPSQDGGQNGGQNDSAAAASPAVQVLFSEEPFWDTIFGPDPLAHRITVAAAGGGKLALHQVNHHRSAVYAFDRIPYFLLTRPEYAARYAVLFARNAKRSAKDWQEAFAARTRGLVFMAERRPEPYHDVSWPQGDLLGLCAWRTRLAETMSNPDRGFGTEKIGSSWGNGQSRFVLGDWHQDKLEGLDGQVRLLSALENTHQPDYLSEKLFDAFAVGARPLYMASPGHRLHDLGLPDAAWINLWGQSSDEAALAIMAAPWDLGFFTAYAEAQQSLARLWTNPEILTAERARLGRALTQELERLADWG